MNCDLIFTDLQYNHSVFGKMKLHQKINHFPGIILIARKNFMAYHLKTLSKKFPRYFDFYPQTFSYPIDKSKIIQLFQEHRKKTMIVKPESGAQGRGIYLVRRLEDIQERSNYVVQHYIANPLLINGFKFDMRFYVLLTSVDPLTIYIYNNGLARLATVPYRKPDDSNISNLFMHLTNYSINKKSSSFNHSDGKNGVFDTGHKRDFKSVKSELKKLGRDPEVVFDEIKKVIVKTLTSIQPILKHAYTTTHPQDFTGHMCFDLLGFDIILDN